jgi:hypothetical protein
VTTWWWAGGSNGCRWLRQHNGVGDGAAAAVEQQPWHSGGVEEHPWCNLGCLDATMALAVAEGELAQAAGCEERRR